VFLARIYGFRFFDSFLLIYPLYGVMFVAHGLTPFQVSLTLMAWSATGFALQIPSGVLADRWSRRWMLCAGQLVRVLGFMAWLFYPGFPGYLAGLVLWGVKSALTNGVFEALVYDELKAAGRPQDYARIMGGAWAVTAVSILLASLAAAVAVKFGYPLVMHASIAGGLVCAVSAVALPRARRSLPTGRADYVAHLAQGFRYGLSHRMIPGVIALLAVSQAFGGGLEGFWPIFGSKAGLSPAKVAVYVAAIAAAQALASANAHRLRTLAAPAFHGLLAAMGLALALAAWIFQPWTVALVVALVGGFKLIDVNFDARLHDAIPSEMRATLAAVRSFAGQVTMTVLLAVFGMLADATSYRTGFLFAGLAMAAGGGGFLLLGRFRPPRGA
jgi:MFS family permease